MVTRIAIFALVATAGMLGCSTDTVEVTPNCGPGTTLADGQCVPAADSSAPSDSAADPSDSAGPYSDALAEAAPDASFDSDIDDHEAGGSDPCPATAPAINCSTSCGGPSANCNGTLCRIDPYAEPFVKITSLPAVVRTPEKPGKYLYCECDGPSAGGSVYSMFVELDVGGPVKITVGNGWRLASSVGSHLYCGEPGDNRTCRIETNAVLITTGDPNALSRNVYFAAAAEGEKCP